MKTNVNTRWSIGLTLSLVLMLAACSKGPSDESISAAIKSGCFSDPVLKNEPIEVTVSNGEVTLAGKVGSDAARLQAYKLAAGTPGVKKVNDKMEVGSAVATEPGKSMMEPPPPEPASTEPEAKKSEAPAAVENAPSDVAPTPPPPPPPRRVTVPAATTVRIRMIDSIDSKTSQVGESFMASLEAPIVVGDKVVVPKGSDVTIKLMNAKSSGKIKGKSELELQLAAIKAYGRSYAVQSSSYREEGASRGKQTAKRVGAGAGIGALIGGIAGGGKGAAIGAGIGAGAGTATQLLTKGPQVKVPSETKLDFDLAAPIQITLPAKKK
jgi:BON domain